MPFTPYHFGPALVAKGLLKNRFCICTFAVSQVIIDLESLFYLLQNDWPVHRFLHTYIGATLAIIISIVLSKLLLRILSLNTTWKAILIAGAFGGYSHVILDSIMHRDIRPLNPFFESNGLLGIMGLSDLHHLCIYSGVLGLIIITWSYFKSEKI
jgi:membrane-bound metal-dependent hydrolase YbcI (DUF457 family)